MSRLEAALQDLRALDTLAARDTALTRRDARAKLVVTLGFLVTVVSFDRYRVAALLPLALFPALLAAWGEVPVRTLWRALALAAPFALMVGLFNPLLDSTPMLGLGGLQLSGGWVSFSSIVLRVGLTVSAVVVMVAGTGMHGLCAAMARLGVPSVFTVQLLFLHRYLFVLSGEALRMNTAYRLRAGARRLDLALYASLTGQLLLRAFDRAQRVHHAMLARGFDGELRTLSAWRWQRADTLFVAGWFAYFVLVRSIDLPLALGRLLTSPIAGPGA
jgi:cobalt/nickel transport system permease protein